jgi:hypothetical protein
MTRMSMSSPPRCVSPFVEMTARRCHHFEDRDVERAAAEVVDGDDLVALLVEPVGKCRGGRLVDDAFDVEPGDLAGVFGGLALGIVEVSRNRDHRFGDLLTDVIFRGLLQLLQHLRGDFRGDVLAAGVERRHRSFPSPS